MKLNWTADAHAACPTGCYRVVLADDLLEVQWLACGRTVWERVSFEDTLHAARITAAVHAETATNTQ